MPAHLYREILHLPGQAIPLRRQILPLSRPDPRDAGGRLEMLLDRERAGTLTAAELAELVEFEQIEHIMLMIKAGVLPFLPTA